VPLTYADIRPTRSALARYVAAHALALSPKGRLIRCTVEGLTPNCSAITRRPGRPGSWFLPAARMRNAEFRNLQLERLTAGHSVVARL